MKKVALVLTVLMFAVPAWAGITVTASQPNPDANEIIVEYVCGDANLPRAFALEIEVNGVNTVLSEPYDVHSEFYVYPGSIVISSGQVTDYGTPVADSDSNSMILEMGSLYASNDPCHTSPPPGSGTLFKFTIDSNDCTVKVSLAGNAARGNVVMEDPDITYYDTDYVTYVGCHNVNVPTCVKDCSCYGDISGPTGVPDNLVSTSDMSALLIYLMPLPGFIGPVPPGYECIDISGPAGYPDGLLSTSDMSALLIYLMPLPGFSGPCMPDPPPAP